METALRHELIQAIPELNNQAYPTNAPEGFTKPCEEARAVLISCPKRGKKLKK